MFKNELRPYEISLWTLQDSFISILKPINVFRKGQIETPKSQIKNDGTAELNFSIPMYYRDNGILVENPIWYNVINGTLIANLRKLKLIFNKGEAEEEVFQFVINKVIETHKDGQLYCEVTSESLAFQELGKIGYKISLSSQDYIDDYDNWCKATVGLDTEENSYDYQTQEEKDADQPLNNINYWAQKIFKNSSWSYEVQMDWSAFDGIISDEDRLNQSVRQVNKIYEEEYISSWTYQGSQEEGKLVPRKIESFKEKLRLVDLEKSNIYNLTQELAKTFGVFCKYKYDYDENYHIIGKKCIFYNNFLMEDEGKIDITYPFHAAKIERETDSADIVTKMFVTPVEDSSSPSGLITIADVSANKMREDYILNFDYLYSIGTISQQQYDYISDYERSIYLINTELQPIASQIANLQTELVNYQAQQTFAREAQIQDQEQMDQAKKTKETVMNDLPFLTKSKENPIRGTMILDEETKTYYVNLTQEGIDYQGKNKYLLSQYTEHQVDEDGKITNSTNNKVYAYGIRLFYYAKVDETKAKVLLPYEDSSLANPDVPNNEEPQKMAIYPSSIQMEIKNGNLTRLTGLKPKEDAISSSIFIACTYSPELHYENIYNYYLNELAKHTAQAEEAATQIQAISKKLDNLQERYELLLDQKAKYIADFENMMGPALRQGSWQADSYTDYGSKFQQEISVGVTNPNSHINFFWDEEPFDEEQLLYYPDSGGLNNQTYYYAISLKNILPNIKDHLEKLSFIYDRVLLSEGKEILLNTHGMIIGSKAFYSFISNGAGEVQPILVLSDKTFSKEKKENQDAYNTNFRIGIITAEDEEGNTIITEEIQVLVEPNQINWIDDLRTKTQLFPRLKSNSLLLKVSEKELIIKNNNTLLKNYYDYSVLIRKENYLITFKNLVMLRDGNLNKTFNIAYTISNAATSLYLDALEVSKTNAFPQVSYKLEVSAMNSSFIKVAYRNLNRIVNINDFELKFENIQGYISELELNLENPWEDTITIQNYKTKFEDLFSTIVASTEQMKINSFSYNNAANSFGPGGTLKPSVIQNTLNQVDLTYAFQSGNLTIDEVNGIWARSDSGVVAMRGGGIFCATEQDSNGNWLWNTGIMPSGINASLITAGQINTNLIKIYSGDNLRFQLNADGLYAYGQQGVGEADFNKYIVHNSEGLFLTDNKINLVEVSWNGFILRNSKGTKVFYADDEGNLTLKGTITATTGNIGGWNIVENGLSSSTGTAGLISSRASEDESNLPYNMFWVTGDKAIDGTNYEFKVTSDGTLWANNVIVKGFVSAGSLIGNSTTEEINNEIRNIEIVAQKGTSFIFKNQNYDGNLVVEPSVLYFRINTKCLSEEELSFSREATEELEELKIETTDYQFYYAFGQLEEEIENWIPISLNEINRNDFFSWEPNYLTFSVSGDIMYSEIEGVKTLQSGLFLKVVKKGKLKTVNAQTSEINYIGNEDGSPWEYSNIIKLFSESYGVGKHISDMDPQSYTFFTEENPEEENLFEETTTFSVILTGFTQEEALRGRWLINGIDTNLEMGLVGSSSAIAESEGGIITTEENLTIGPGTIVEEGDDIIGYDDTPSDGFEVFLEPLDDGTLRAYAVVANTRIATGDSIRITFKMDSAMRDAFCFKTRNGTNGIVIVIDSTSGDTLVSGDISTILSVRVQYGMQLMNGEDSKQTFYYVWKVDDVALSTLKRQIIVEKTDEEGIIYYETDQEEIPFSTVNETFFQQKSIYVSAADFGVKAIYTCDVFTSYEEALAEYYLMNKNGDIETE